MVPSPKAMKWQLTPQRGLKMDSLDNPSHMEVIIGPKDGSIQKGGDNLPRNKTYRAVPCSGNPGLHGKT